MKRVTQLYRDLHVDFGQRVDEETSVRVQFGDLNAYISECLPNRAVYVSDIYLWGARDIEGYCAEETLYSHVIYKFGFLPIGRSMSTDHLAVDMNDGRVIWFDRSHFMDGFGSLISRDRREVEANRENLDSVGLFVCRFSELFIMDVLVGRYSPLFSILD